VAKTAYFDLKSAERRQRVISLVLGKNIALGPSKISPKVRCLGQDYLDSHPQEVRVQLIILGLNRLIPAIAKAIDLDPPTDFRR